MKKWFILLSFILIFGTGCFDYTELNDMAIISGISIDYEENLYKVAFEILNTQNKENVETNEKVFLANGSGSSISEAFSNAALEIADLPYMAHLKTIIISEDVAKEHVEEIIDFLIRDNHIRNIFYLTIAKDTSAYLVLSHTDKNNPVVSTAVSNLIDSDIYSNHIAAELNFEQFVMNIIDPRKDTYVSSIEIQDDILKLGPIAIFKNYNMQNFLTEEESATFNVMNGESKEIHFKVNCPNNENNFIVLTTFNKPKTETKIEGNNVTLKAEVETRVVENHCELDFKEVSTYERIQEKIKEKLIKDMQNVMEKSLQNESDILRIEQIYYQKYKKEVDFTKLNYYFDANAIINRNGLIFEVKS